MVINKASLSLLNSASLTTRLTEEGSKKLEITLSLVIVCLTTAVYCQMATHQFLNYDDSIFVFENSHVCDGLTVANLKWAFTTLHGNASYWHPITWMSHQLDCTLFGLHPEAHHLTNLCIHLANSVLLLRVLRELTGKVWRSAMVAAMFALHPMHVETVAWISERKGVLCAFFWFLTLWAYVRYTRRPSVGKYLAVVTFGAASMMSKPFAVTLPFGLLVLDFWPLRRLDFLQAASPNVGGSRVPSHSIPQLFWLIVEKFPLLAMAGVSSWLTVIAQRQLGAVASLNSLPIKLRIANSIVAHCLYIGKMIWPTGLSPIYPFQTHWPWWQVLGCAIFLCSTSVAAVRLARSHPYFLAGWLWYLGTLFPVNGLFQAGIQGMADRYTYIPFTGLFISVIWGINDAISSRPRLCPVATLCGLMAVSVLAISALFQVGYWKNSIRLFERAVSVTHANFMAYYLLGLAFNARHNPTEAKLNFEEAIRINPRESMIHADLGHVLFENGDTTSALLEYNRALELKPDYAQCHAMIAELYGDSSNMRVFDITKAAYHVERACELSHYEKREFLVMLSGVYCLEHKFRDAGDIAKRALKISSSFQQITECNELIAKINENIVSPN